VEVLDEVKDIILRENENSLWKNHIKM
jgi:hypothetical protein